MISINLNQFQKHVQNFMNIVKSTGDAKVDEQTFTEKVTNDRSIFEMLDHNHDGKISQDEIETVCQADTDNDGIVTENELICMQEMKFYAKRTVDKWFTLDVDRDCYLSNVETELGKHRMGGDAETYTGLDAAMSNEQLANLYNMKETVSADSESLEMHLDGWLDYLKQMAKDQFGIELNDRQIIVLKNEYKKQLNTWLFKTGDNATGNAPLYNSLNNTAYTRLVTTKQTVSCCGGDIVPPPAADNKNSCSFVFSDLESEGSSNSAEEVKNRLAWAMFKTPPKNELSNNPKGTVWENMTDRQYAQYHEQYQTMRNMKASDFRELLKPENEQRRIAFEQNSSMTVQQIVDYIDIVEQQIGAGNFDNDNWSVSAEQYHQIVLGINGTVGNEDKLQGKTRADVPDNRQYLLRFLEEKGWLYEQFKL